MENFSTHRVALLPRAANLATLAVVVAATWWSSAQRPAEQPALAAQSVENVSAGNNPAALPQQQATGLAATGGNAHWPVQAGELPHDGLQAVGFQPRATR